MKKDTGSATAVAAAMLRAAHQLIDGKNKLLDDPIILKIIPDEWKSWLLQNRFYYFEPEMMALRTHIVLRSRYAEDCLKEAYHNGVRQFIILGAGLDTFAYRQPAWAKNINIIEADHPASQAEKLTKLQEARIPIPENLSFVAIDLEKDDLTIAFNETALQLSEPIFMACLGVLVYLSKNCVDKIFQFAGTFPAKSEFVFTISHQRDSEKLNCTAERAATAGEPWITHFNQENLQAQLTSVGFKEVTFLTPEATISRYFEGSGLQLPPPRRNSLVRAIIS